MKILVVEDEPNNMKLMTFILKKYGHEPVEAVNGMEGIEKATSLHPDLILMDIRLPDFDGLEAARRIRKNVNMKQVPIIAATSQMIEGYRNEIIKAGCNGFIQKPINPLTIMGELENILSSLQSGK